MNKISQERLDNGLYWERSLELVPGCSPVSEACDHCWSALQTHMRSFQKNPKIRERYAGLTDEKGNWTGKIRLREDLLDLPLKVRKPTVWAIWNDLFHKDVPFEFVVKVYNTIYKCCSIYKCCLEDNPLSPYPSHIFLILTKRPKRMLEFYNYCVIKEHMVSDSYLENLWIGITAENQRTADERIPILLQIPATIRFVSVEPCLERIDITNYLFNLNSSDGKNKISLLILGAESGPKRRPCDIKSIRNIKDQCQEAGIPLFIKQLHIDGKLVKDINKFPEDLKIREFPKI